MDVGCGDVDFEHGEVSPVRLDSSMDISTTLRQKNIIWLHINQTNIPRQVSHIFQIQGTRTFLANDFNGSCITIELSYDFI